MVLGVISLLFAVCCLSPAGINVLFVVCCVVLFVFDVFRVVCDVWCVLLVDVVRWLCFKFADVYAYWCSVGALLCVRCWLRFVACCLLRLMCWFAVSVFVDVVYRCLVLVPAVFFCLFAACCGVCLVLVVVVCCCLLFDGFVVCVQFVVWCVLVLCL